MGQIIYVLLKQKKQTIRPSWQHYFPTDWEIGWINCCNWNMHVCMLTHRYTTVCKHFATSAIWFLYTITRSSKRFSSPSCLLDHLGKLSHSTLGSIPPCFCSQTVTSALNKSILRGNNSLRFRNLQETARWAMAILLSHHVFSTQESRKERHFPERRNQRKTFHLHFIWTPTENQP